MSSAQERPTPPFSPQHVEALRTEAEQRPGPQSKSAELKRMRDLRNKVALVTGVATGIGRAVAVHYAREGVDVAIVHLPEEQVDAEEIRRAVEAEGRRAVLIPGDVNDESFCREAVEQTVRELGRLDILVNNAAFQ